MNKRLIILYVLIVIILVTFLAAIISIIAKQFTKKISLEGYTAVPTQFTPLYTSPSSKNFSISGAILHDKIESLPLEKYRPPVGAIMSFPFVSPSTTTFTVDGVVYAVCNGQKLYKSQVAKSLQSLAKSESITMPDLRNKTLKQQDTSTSKTTSVPITIYPYGSERNDTATSTTKLASTSTAIDSSKLLSYEQATTATLSSVLDDHQNVIFAMVINYE